MEAQVGALTKGALVAGGGAAALGAVRWAMGQRRGRTARALVEDGIQPTQRIVVLGAVLGGLYVVIRRADAVWDAPDREVLLIDRHNYHLFTPMLTLVAGSAVEPRNVAFPVRRLLRDHHLHYRRAEGESIDPQTQTVATTQGPVHYDKLVIALGAVSNFFGLNDVEKYGFTFKTMTDAIEIRNHVVDCFERAATSKDPEERRSLLSFVIVGGGPTGVELAASLH